MYRVIPVGSKLLQRRWDQKEREIHKSKLREMKPSVDVKEPVQFRHIKKKLKKNQMLEGIKICLFHNIICISCWQINNLQFNFIYIDRYTEIERENRILLEKMTHIM